MQEQGGGRADRDPRRRVAAPGVGGRVAVAAVVLCVAGAALLFATGRTALALVALAGAGVLLVPRMGARYDRGGAPDDPWAALDRGEDPTDTIPR